MANPVEIRLSGNDSDELFVIVDRIKQSMAKINGLNAL